MAKESLPIFYRNDFCWKTLKPFFLELDCRIQKAVFEMHAMQHERQLNFADLRGDKDDSETGLILQICVRRQLNTPTACQTLIIIPKC